MDSYLDRAEGYECNFVLLSVLTITTAFENKYKVV